MTAGRPRNPAERTARIAQLVEFRPRCALALARAAAQRSSGQPPGEQARASHAYGWVAIHAEAHQEALASLRAALERLEPGGDSAAARDCRCGILVARWLHGERAELQAEWAALLADYEQAGQGLAADQARVYQLAHLNFIDRSDEVARLGPPLLARWPDGTAPSLRCRLLRIIATAFANLSRPADAEPWLRQAEELAAAHGSPVDVAKCMLDRGFLLANQESFRAAWDALDLAQARLDRLGLPLSSALCRRARGFVLSRLGRFAEALRLTLAARSEFRRLQRRDLAAGCDLNMGTIAYYTGLTELSYAAYRRAQLVFDQLGAAEIRCMVKRNQAMLLGRKDRYDQALRLLEGIRAEVEALHNPLEHGEFYAAMADLWRHKGDIAQASACYAQASAIFARAGNQPNVAECQLNEAWMLIDQGAFEQARPRLEAAAGLLGDRPMHEWRRRHGLAICAERRADHPAALAEYLGASALIADMRQKLVNEHASSALFAQAETLYRDALRFVARQGDSAHTFQLLEQQRALSLVQQLIQPGRSIPADLRPAHDAHRARLGRLADAEMADAETESAIQDYIDFLIQLRHSGPPGAAQPFATPPLDQIGARLGRVFGAEWSLLSYSQIGAELCIVYASDQGAGVEFQPLDDRLTALLATLCQPAQRLIVYSDLLFLHDQAAHAWQDLEALTERLIPAAIRCRLNPGHRLLIAPCAPLHQLPWAALRVAGAWLCQHAVVQLVPSFAIWESLHQRLPAGRDALLVGCAEFGRRASPLAQALPEIAAVAALAEQAPEIAAVHVLAGPAATRAALMAQAEDADFARYRLIHIASHAQLVAMQGLLAHIKLADENIFYNDIVDLGLAGATVVLSTCDGAAPESLPGEEVLSLSRAFLAGGAREVVANIWPTSDQRLQPLIAAFYAAWLAGADAATALALAQRALIASAEADLQSPMLWGGFQIQGAGTPLPAPAADPPPARR